jgi:hypothetical protein
MMAMRMLMTGVDVETMQRSFPKTIGGKHTLDALREELFRGSSEEHSSRDTG